MKIRILTEQQRTRKNARTHELYRLKNPVVKSIRSKIGASLSKKYPAELMSFSAMRTRCSNPKQETYKDYGARGIKVCERWAHFANFMEDMGPKPSPEYTIERDDNDGHYEPGNCRWATRQEQAVNKRSNVLVEVDGEKMLITHAASSLGIKQSAVLSRRHRGITDIKDLLAIRMVKKNLIFLTHNGVTLPPKDWALKLSISYTTFISRWYAKLPPHKLFYQGKLRGSRQRIMPPYKAE